MGVLNVILTAVIGFVLGYLLKKVFRMKVFIILHLVFIIVSFVSTFGYSFTWRYQAQSLPWTFFFAQYVALITTSFISGVLIDKLINRRKVK